MMNEFFKMNKMIVKKDCYLLSEPNFKQFLKKTIVFFEQIFEKTMDF